MIDFNKLRIDFDKIREENAKKAVLATTAKAIPITPAKEPKPRAKDRDREEDISALELLAGKFRSNLNDWERQFIDSNLLRMRKYDNATLSVKQAEHLDKIWEEKAVGETKEEDFEGEDPVNLDQYLND